MKSIVIKVMLVSVALGAAVFSLTGSASAVRVLVEIAIPNPATVGQPAEIQATVRSVDEGQPMAGAPVTFYMDASFANVNGEVELGQAVTDENGIAALSYEPRAAGDHEIRVEYMVPGDSEPEVATASIFVDGDGVTQLHHSTAGVNIPGLNVWLIMAVVATVWGILLSVAFRVIAISRAGGDAGVTSESHISGAR